MKGWRTLAFALSLSVAGVLQAFNWASVVPQDQTWSGVAMLLVGAAVAALRYVTTSPVFKAN